MPTFEIELRQPKGRLVFGIDEAGRGPWAGPVSAAAVCFVDGVIDEVLVGQIKDSKKMTVKKREEVFEMLLKSNAIIGIGLAEVEEIDSMNILQATFLAMKRAVRQVESLGYRVDHCLIDGNQHPKWEWSSECIIGGDDRSVSIAAASIVAKVTRDRIMAELAVQYPHYGWEKNAGYGTKDHVAALKKHGVCPAHRKSYKPIKNLILIG